MGRLLILILIVANFATTIDLAGVFCSESNCGSQLLSDFQTHETQQSEDTDCGKQQDCCQCHFGHSDVIMFGHTLALSALPVGSICWSYQNSYKDIHLSGFKRPPIV